MPSCLNTVTQLQNSFSQKKNGTYFIIQAGLLRRSAGYTSTNSEVQSNLYRIEYIIETTLKKIQAPAAADECIYWLKHFGGFSNDYLDQFLNELTFRFVFDETIHKKRINRLPRILQMTWEYSEEYKSFRQEALKIASEKGWDPRIIEFSREWPDFIW